MYLKENKCGRIKGHGCVNNQKQRLHSTKYNATSPTISIEHVFLTSIIDAKQERNIATTNIPGAYLNAKIGDNIIVIFDGTMAEILETIPPAVYRLYIHAGTNSKPVMGAISKKSVQVSKFRSIILEKKIGSLL